MNAIELTRATRRMVPLAGTTALLVAGSLAAQEPPLGTPAPPDRECVCAWEGEAPRMLRSAFRFNRARLGVVLGEEAQADGRTGIRLRDVEEGGPAARAGIRAGDILLSLEGQDLGDDPGDRLLDLLSDVEPGDTVAVGYSRDGRDLTARVVTDRAQSIFSYAPGGEARVWSFPRAPLPPDAPGFPGNRLRMRQLFGDGLELVEMNEGLGRYFDTTDGVLVADVDEESRLGLRAGDVILSIGGRAVQDPDHARSIIASYRSDEEIRFEVMRDGRRTTVTGTRDR